jgi:hypothetical protein
MNMMLSVICPEAMTANLLITAILWHISNKNKINQTITWYNRQQ